MMTFHVLTLFPDLIRSIVETSITGRAIRDGILEVNTVNIRDFSIHGTMRVDDYPYGGGAGMVFEAEPVYQAVCSVKPKNGSRPRVIYLTPQAKVLDQTMVESLAQEEELILLCGHYEGIDERVLEEVVTDYISIGDYVLTGGELPAAVLIDAVARFIPGVLNNEESAQFESMQDHLLEYPHYTRPEIWHDRKVPAVLLSGDHEKVEEWRHEQSIRRTQERRPDLLALSRQVYGIWFGDEVPEQRTQELCRALSRFGILQDYNRRKLQKQRNSLPASALLILVIPDNAEEEMPFAERMRNLKGQDTPCVLIGTGTDTDLSGTVPFLKEKGFRVIRTETAAEQWEAQTIAEKAIAIRQDLEAGL